jgi:hypothetical protein
MLALLGDVFFSVAPCRDRGYGSAQSSFGGDAAGNAAAEDEPIAPPTKSVPPGVPEVPMDLANDGGGLAKGGNVTFSIDRTEVGGGHIGATVPLLYSADETLDVG